MGCACLQALGVCILGLQAAMRCSAVQHSACVDLVMPCRCNIGSPAAAASSSSPMTKVTNLSHSTRSSLLGLAPRVGAWGWELAPGGWSMILGGKKLAASLP